jgi:hypothetical protein
VCEDKLLTKVSGPSKDGKYGVADITNDKFFNIHKFNYYYYNNKKQNNRNLLWTSYTDKIGEAQNV